MEIQKNAPHLGVGRKIPLIDNIPNRRVKFGERTTVSQDVQNPISCAVR